MALIGPLIHLETRRLQAAGEPRTVGPSRRCELLLQAHRAAAFHAKAEARSPTAAVARLASVRFERLRRSDDRRVAGRPGHTATGDRLSVRAVAVRPRLRRAASPGIARWGVPQRLRAALTTRRIARVTSLGWSSWM